MSSIIAIEGLSGSGKSTVRDKVIKYCISQGISSCFVDIENIPHAAALRRVAEKFPPMHLSRVFILWALRIIQFETAVNLGKKHDLVIMDRSWGTPIAIDGYARGIPMSFFNWVEKIICKGKPSMTLFLELPYKIARGRKLTKILRNDAFAKKIEQGYHKTAINRGWIIIDATMPPEQVFEECKRYLALFLSQSHG